jgi:hypothetical protein
MITRRSILALAMITTSLLLCGCVANRAYRRGDEVLPSEPPRSIDGILPSNADCASHPGIPLASQPQHYYLAHIEFDDMGELWSIGNLRGEKRGASPSSQLENALAIIQTAQALANKPGDQRELTVITFVHGWHNNASGYDEVHKDKNLASFKSMMQELSCGDETQTPPVLVGIFLSWRGQAISGDPGFTYWNRRNAATRVGGPSMTEVVTRLMFETKGVPIAPSPDAKSRCEPPDVKGKDLSHFVIIAHSFGARALEHALTEPMLSMILERQMQAQECAEEYNANNPGKPITDLIFLPPADLIVFLNAANDAFEAKETIEALKRGQIRVGRKKINDGQAESIDTTAPFMISITSDGDWATKKIMPVAQWFSSVPLRFRSYDKKNCAEEGQLCGLSQRYYYTHSEASLSEMRSHLVVLAKDASSCNSLPPPWPYFEVHSTNRCFCVDSSRDHPNPTDKCGADTDDRTAYFGAKPGWNDTPFYVMGVPESLIKDHNDIFQEGTVQLLSAISKHYEILFKSKERVTMSSPIATKP